MADTILQKRAIFFYGGFASRTGGAFMHVTTLSEGLQAQGWATQTFTLDRLPRIVRYLPHAVGRLVNRFAPPLGFYYKGVTTRLLFRLFTRRRPTDLLIFEDIYLGWNSANPSLTVLHAVWSDNLQSYTLSNRQIERLKAKEVASIIRLSHPVVTVSRRYADFMTETHFAGFKRINLKVVELGLNTAKFDCRKQSRVPQTGRSLIYCGTLEARKNVRFMLDVFRSIAAKDQSATLTIVGDGPDRDELERYALQSQLAVTFLGRLPHERVLEELTNHNIYIHTAVKESFSFALLEAKLSGLTTCALSTLEIPEEFIDVGFGGFDAAEWSSRILAIGSRPNMEAFPDYSIARMTKRTLSLVAMS